MGKIQNLRQDHRMLKSLGLFKNEAMRMPGDESTTHPPEGFRCFLGIHLHWGLRKRIFYLHRNNSKNTIYNVGGGCICVRPEARYFDVKFANSVQGWRKKWLYVKDESSDAQEYGLAPFDPSEDIQRRKSWDAEAIAEEIAATESLIARIRALQNTEGEELSDSDKVSEDLPLKDLERITALFLLFLPFLKVEMCLSEPSLLMTCKRLLLSRAKPQILKRTRVPLMKYRDKNKFLFPPKQTLLLLRLIQISIRGKKTLTKKIPASQNCLNRLLRNLHPRNLILSALLLSDDEELPEADAFEPAPTSTSHMLVLFEDPKVSVEAASPQPSPRAPKKKPRTSASPRVVAASGNIPTSILNDPLMKEMSDMTSRFIGFRDEAESLRRNLHLPEDRAAELERKLQDNEEARLNAEKKAATVDDLRERLHEAENALSQREQQITQREHGIVARLQTQSSRFSTERIGEKYILNEDKEEDPLLEDFLVDLGMVLL
ncbi:uncharacterized protein [Lolium perenne]|uniref:uncharacterized protein n=1 Tax=Lolium perenne TaxID=4522 RepID=UPI0021F6815D|nr:uncharacterized protein LOC127348207 [Lolium perenne]